jgi:hypothetical protein
MSFGFLLNNYWEFFQGEMLCLDIKDLTVTARW